MNKIREYRIKKGYAMQTVAGMIGFSKQRYRYIELVEDGRKLTENTVRRIAKALEVSPYELMGDEWMNVVPRTEEEFVDAVESLRAAFDKAKVDGQESV